MVANVSKPHKRLHTAFVLLGRCYSPSSTTNLSTFTHPQTIFKPSVHHPSRFFGKLFGGIGGAVFVVGFGATHNETLGVAATG